MPFQNRLTESQPGISFTGAFTKKYLDINDTYGHEFCDKVLRAVSKMIREVLRNEDYFICYGSEEFVIIVTKATSERILDVAERIRKAIENLEIFNEAVSKNIILSIEYFLSNTHSNQT